MGDNATVLVRAKMNWGGLRYDEIGLVDAAQAEPLLEDGRLELVKEADVPDGTTPIVTATVQDPAPPRAGAGSGRDAWAAYAASQKVPVGDSDSREQIIEALEAAGKPT
jgi:hypothetical protein